MNMKKGLICLLIVAMLTLCVPNVAAAQASKQTDEVHGGYKLDATVGGQPTLLSHANHNVTAVNTSFDLFGGLATRYIKRDKPYRRRDNKYSTLEY